MANTRTAAKRAQQSHKRHAQNIRIKGTAKTVLKKAIEALQGKDAEKAKAAFAAAVRYVSKAGSKGVIPKGRAARKISRLTRLAKKNLPGALPFQLSQTKK